jgi:DNA polymerase-1
MEWNREKTTEVIKSLSQLEKYKEAIESASLLAVDTETTGLDQGARLIGISLSPNEDLGIYIPTLIFDPEQGLINPWKQEAYNQIIDWLTQELTKSQRLIGHNAPYDARILKKNLNLEIINYFTCDTGLLHHTIDENPPHGLKPLAVKYLEQEADSSQKDLEDSVKANGGKWLVSDKQFYKGDVEILGEYACRDSIYTFGLYNRLWPELETQGLLELWNTEVHPLMQVTYELNTGGFDVSLDYYQELDQAMTERIEALEDEMYAQIADQVRDYEYQAILDKQKITPRSRLGRAIMEKGWKEGDDTEPYKDDIIEAFCKWKGKRFGFNFSSNNDKAFLLFDVLGLPEQGLTDSGKRKVTASIIDKLTTEYEETSDVLKLLKARNKEIKLQSTYVHSVLNNSENGRIYTSFNQTGTTSGRYSSSKPINFQNLPRDDSRIKKGFKSSPGYVLVAADYSSLEPRAFSVVSEEDGIKEIFWKDLDFYSKLYVDTFKESQYSADPTADNFLKKLNAEARQNTKAWALGIPYGASAWRVAQLLNIEPDEAQKIVDSYMKAYPNLAKWMKRTEFLGRKQGYIESKAGRRRRCPLVKALYDDHKVTTLSRNKIKRIFKTGMYGYDDPVKLYLAARNESNNIKNFQIQSLAASIVNEAMIDFTKRRGNLDARIVSTIHDEIILEVKEEQADQAAKLLQECMEKNRLTSQLDVPMIAEPIIGKDLASVK